MGAMLLNMSGSNHVYIVSYGKRKELEIMEDKWHHVARTSRGFELWVKMTPNQPTLCPLWTLTNNMAAPELSAGGYWDLEAMLKRRSDKVGL